MSTRRYKNPPIERPNSFSIDSSIKELHSALAQDSVVDGFKHVAEPILERAFAREPEKMGNWFERLITEHRDPSKIADILRLLARFKPHTPQWRQQIVRVALASRSPDVRDAAMQAVESWAGQPLADLLRSHRETAKWLTEYAAQVVRDLSG
jgi:hypothetical protein